MRANHEVCFIGGAGHSGSTLLGLMLGSHPDVFYAGEAKKSVFIGNERKPLRKRVCKLCGEGCPIWGTFRFPENGDLYEAVSARAGRRLVVDSTKTVAWVQERLDAMPPGSRPFHVFLTRDGRAVVTSRIRKYPDVDPRVHIEEWKRQIEDTRALVARFPGPTTTIRYEELATDPRGSIARLVAFLSLPSSEEILDTMTDPWAHEHHPLGGNAGTQWLLARERAETEAVVTLGARTRSYYGSHPAAIKLDMRWKAEMPAGARALFDALAGETNADMAWEGEPA